MEKIIEDNIVYLKSDKFKQNQLRLSFLFDDNEDILAFYILANCLFSSTKKYPTKRDINNYIEDLYDASFAINAKTIGIREVFYVKMSYVMDKYSYDGITKDAVDFIKEVIYNPNLIDGHFSQEIFDREIRLTLETLDRERDNKFGYAMKQLVINDSTDESLNPSSYITKEKVNALTLDDITNAYKKLLDCDNLAVYIFGEVDIKLFESFKKKPFVYKNVNPLQNYSVKNKDYSEIINANQTIYTVSYTTKINYLDFETRYKMFMFNQIFGSNSNSLLFRVLREENSLCYTVQSMYNPYTSLVSIVMGLDKDNIEKTKKLIDEILVDIINDNYSNEVFQNAQSSMCSGLLDSLDEINTTILREESMNIYNRDADVFSVIETYKAVTREDISLMAKKLQKDISFTLIGDENANI